MIIIWLIILYLKLVYASSYTNSVSRQTSILAGKTNATRVRMCVSLYILVWNNSEHPCWIAISLIISEVSVTHTRVNKMTHKHKKYYFFVCYSEKYGAMLRSCVEVIFTVLIINVNNILVFVFSIFLLRKHCMNANKVKKG